MSRKAEVIGSLTGAVAGMAMVMEKIMVIKNNR